MKQKWMAALLALCLWLVLTTGSGLFLLFGESGAGLRFGIGQTDRKSVV